ncbi:MAG: amino acid ABC transporter permease [Clostridia bacterium]|nr:amino acid ABC transporter permease [Clostridia bacterium]MBR3684793.1 amino acid ABC transporter permease [Clostridia bacterium]
MKLDFSIIFRKEILLLLLKSYGWTLAITVMALAIGIILGTLLAVFMVLPKDKFINKVLNAFSQTYLAIIRGTPVLVQLMIICFVIFADVIFFNREISPYIIATIGFGLNSAAYVAEIMRAGIMSVDRGQFEAGRAVGLSYGTTMKRIILPQSAKNILPPLGNEAIVLLKETSVALIIGVSEFFTAIKGIVNTSYNVITPYLFAAIVYFITVYLISFGLKLLERRLQRSERN